MDMVKNNLKSEILGLFDSGNDKAISVGNIYIFATNGCVRIVIVTAVLYEYGIEYIYLLDRNNVTYVLKGDLCNEEVGFMMLDSETSMWISVGNYNFYSGFNDYMKIKPLRFYFRKRDVWYNGNHAFLMARKSDYGISLMGFAIEDKSIVGKWVDTYGFFVKEDDSVELYDFDKVHDLNEMYEKEEDARKALEEMTDNVPAHGRIVEEYTISIFEDDTFEDFQERLDTVSDVAWKLHFKKLNK